MSGLIIFFILALVARNAIYLGFISEVVRGTALLVAGIWGWGYMLTHRVKFKKYWAHICYLATCYLSLWNAADVPYVLFQVLSLTVVIIFSFAIYEAGNATTTNRVIFKTVLYSYIIIMLMSLVWSKLYPSMAYEVLWAGETRFRGVFAKSGMLASSAGALIVLALYFKSSFVIKSFAIISGGACLVLTQSRTFWIALIVSVAVTEVLYRRGTQKKLLLTSAFCMLLFGIVYGFNIDLKSDSAKSFLRIDTVSNLTGRVSLWKEALAAFELHPFIGVGLTAGSTSLGNPFSNWQHTEDLETGRIAGRATMHNGYIQSLLDLGLVGSSIYLIIVVLPLFLLYKRDRDRAFKIEFCMVSYFAIANFAENVIYAVTVFNSCLFFMLSVHAVNIERPCGTRLKSQLKIKNELTLLSKNSHT